MTPRSRQRVARNSGLSAVAFIVSCGSGAPTIPPPPLDAASVDRAEVTVLHDALVRDLPSATDAPIDAPPTADVVSDDTPSAMDVAPIDVLTPPDVAPSVDVDTRGIPTTAALYTADRMRFGIRDIAGAVTHALAAPGADNVILYVHGRGCGGGGEPNKSLTEAMPSLARDYTAAPILLFWPGSDDSCPLGFPESRAREAGPALAAVLGDLHRDQLAHPRPAVRFTLLTHSMGSLVLEAATAVSGVSALPSSVFATALVNAGASAAPDHANWLARVTFAGTVFATVNNDDLVLTAAGIGRATRLGKSLTGARLAAGREYVDFTANNVNHAYYIPSGQSGAAMMAYYQRVMNGLPYDFATSTGISGNDTRDGAIVHRFNGR